MSTALRGERTYSLQVDQDQPVSEITGGAGLFAPLQAIQGQAVCAGDGDCIYCLGPETD